MSNEVEEYSEDLKRESEQELRGAMGKTQIAFFDIENMSGMAQVITFVVVAAAIGGVIFYIFKELMAHEPDANEIRKEALRARQEKKTN